MGSPPSRHPRAPVPSEDLPPPAGAPPAPDSLTPDILLRFVQDAVIGTDLAFRITSWNPGAEALYGWSAAEVLGQTVRAVLHTQFLDDEEEHVLAQFQTAGTWRGEVFQQHRDGHAIAIMASVSLVRSPTGEPLGAVSVNRDISERKAAEQARQRAAERLHVLAEASRTFAEAGMEAQALLDQVAQLTAERLTAACTIRLLSEDAQWLETCAVGHYRQAERETLHAFLGPERVPVDAPNPAALVIRSGQPQLTPIVDPEALRAAVPPGHQAILAQFFPRSRLTVPLRARGHPIGSLACARFDPDQPPFDEDDLRLILDLADRAALAISNVHLLQEVQAARQVAAESFARLDALITSLPTGVGYLDHDLRYQLVNPALAALNRRAPAAHVGRTMSDIIPRLAPRLEPLARQVLTTGEAVRDLELHDQPAGPAAGAAQDWLISYFPVRDTAGAVTGVGVTITDITAITRTTAALRETEHKLRTLFELLPVGVSIFDATGAVVAMNPAQEAIFQHQQAGLALEDVLDRPFVRPDGTPRPRAELATERALHERQPALNVESGFVSATGETHWITASAVPVDFADWRVVAVASDITARVQAEEARRASEARFRLLAEHAQDLIYRYRLAPEPGFEYVSPSATALTGYTPEEHYADPQLGTRLVEPEERHLLGQATAGQMEGPLTLRWRRKDGTVIWTEQLNRLIRNSAGEPVAIEGIARDVTARKQAEEQVRAAHARLQQLSQRLLETQEQERRHLARELHDEVGQALTGLRLSLELARRLPPEERDGYLAAAHQVTQELIARVRALSLDLRPAMLDDMGLLPTLRWQLTRYGDQTGIAVDFRQRGLEQRLPLPVETVAYRVVQEALTNVARYAGVTSVSVSVLASAERLRIQVRDTGRGFVLDEALAGGHSSGLAGMQERVSLLGGKLLIETAPGAGTCITVGLPLGETHP